MPRTLILSFHDSTSGESDKEFLNHADESATTRRGISDAWEQEIFNVFLADVSILCIALGGDHDNDTKPVLLFFTESIVQILHLLS